MDNDDLVDLIAELGKPRVDNEGFYGTYNFRVGHRLYHACGSIGEITTLCFSEVNVITGEARSAICVKGKIKGLRGDYAELQFPTDAHDFRQFPINTINLSMAAMNFSADEDAVEFYQKVRELVLRNIQG